MLKFMVFQCQEIEELSVFRELSSTFKTGEVRTLTKLCTLFCFPADEMKEISHNFTMVQS